MPFSQAQRVSNAKCLAAGKPRRHVLPLTSPGSFTVDETWSAQEQNAMTRNVIRIHEIALLLADLDLAN
jgi:hypothetical protein